MAEKILLDTDIGSDIDDAVCLAYLLANPDCDLLGITTVSGQPVERARLASALCIASGHDEVPTFPGAAEPLRWPVRQGEAPQAAVLDQWPHRENFPEDRAVEFLAEAISDNPGEVTLLAIGPMTNVALLFERHPETASLLKRVSLMIGRFGVEQIGARPGEWNAYCDPDAARAVFGTKPNSLRAVGLDVTTKVRMDSSEVRERFATGPLRPVLDMAEVWFSNRELITFHDPLAAVTIFDTGVCTFERGTASVETEDEAALGLTRWQPGVDGPHEVGVGVDADLFFGRYFEVFE
ncbi:MAG: nucleoside hydrolase [Dehalococcoidia bacterium]